MKRKILALVGGWSGAGIARVLEALGGCLLLLALVGLYLSPRFLDVAQWLVLAAGAIWLVAMVLPGARAKELAWTRSAQVAFVTLALGQMISIGTNQKAARAAADRAEVADRAAERREARRDSAENAREGLRNKRDEVRRAQDIARRDSLACLAIRVALQGNYDALRVNTEALQMEIMIADSGRSLVPPLYPLDETWWARLQDERPLQLVASPESFGLLRVIHEETGFYVRTASAREDFRVQNLLNTQVTERSLARRLKSYDQVLVRVGTRLRDTLLVRHSRLHGWPFEQR